MPDRVRHIIQRVRANVFPKPAGRDGSFLAEILRLETVGGALLLVAAVAALILANSPVAEGYFGLSDYHLGPLSVKDWAQDGLLTIFFFVAGLELKRELVVGTLRRPAQALVPIVAAICGMAAPAIIFVLVALAESDPTALRGWAIPTATDIAFALAVLAVAGSALPTALRVFLLTLAIVDDLGAITIIAIFYTEELHWQSLLGAIVLLALYLLLQWRRKEWYLLYVPLGVAAWWFMHESGVHATVAGVLLGLLTRARPDDNEDAAPAERYEHAIRPLSAGFCVPLFALFAAGVPISGDEFVQMLKEPVAIGVVLGLVLGKIVGVTGGAWLTTKVTRAELSEDLTWRDVAAVSVLAGIGFTVALLVAELAFGNDPHRADLGKAAVLLASLIAALAATVMLRLRARALRKASVSTDTGSQEGTD